MKMNIQYKNNWVSLYLRPCKLSFVYNVAGYFDERPYIHLELFLLDVYLTLPIKTGIDECEPSRYGFYLYGEGLGRMGFDQLWICLGEKSKCINLPWALDWVRTSNLRRDGNWEHETKGNRKDFYKDEWNDVIWSETHPYKYVLRSGKEQHVQATIKVSEREWRPLWFKWTKLFAHVKRDIEIEFDNEVGERTGSWKGGVLGCSYKMLPNETPLECLRRMEGERKFN